MTPQEFVSKWRGNLLSERSAAQQHFLDLCALFEHPTPAAIDKLGEEFTFERGLTKTGGGGGFADVWKRGFFAFEYKKQKRNLDAALEQLTRYASALENPPLHVACDTQQFKIVTAWTNLVPQTFELTLDDLLDPDKRRILWNVFHDPDALRPDKTREKLTREAADKFITVADRLNHRHPERENVAHFINQLVFCFFAEDVGLLPRDPTTEREGYFTKLLKTALKNPARAKPLLDSLFEAMQHGGPHGIEEINHFNGGLFDDRRAFPLQADELRILVDLGRLDWDLIDPTIFGTLFERFLDPEKRKQIGAHYTPPEKIMQIVEPVIVRPLLREWDEAKARITGLLDGSIQPPKSKLTTGRIKPKDAATGVRQEFLDRLARIRVLDPACGSGNFLYLALHAIKDIENRALLETEALGLSPQAPVIDPEILYGIELNPVAAELARTTIWIGYIQWEIRNMVGVGQRPILKRLDTIECRDALVTHITHSQSTTPSPLPHAGEGASQSEAGEGQSPIRQSSPTSPLAGEVAQVSAPPPTEAVRGDVHPDASRSNIVTPIDEYVEAKWPDAEFIIGNPPFLGGKFHRKGRPAGRSAPAMPGLGDAYTDRMYAVFDGKVPSSLDLVAYWFWKAAKSMSGATKAFGLVATKAMARGRSGKFLDSLITSAGCSIRSAWTNEPWVVEGAEVRVSIVCCDFDGDAVPRSLNGVNVPRIENDLTASSLLLKARTLVENKGRSFQGVKQNGPFEINGGLARHWLNEPTNPNGRPNSDVIRRFLENDDVTMREGDHWVIDFTEFRKVHVAALYARPFEHTRREVTLFREKLEKGQKSETERLASHWLMQRPRTKLRAAITEILRCIVVPETSEHLIFRWARSDLTFSGSLFVVARDDDTTFGVLSSGFHRAWANSIGNKLGAGNQSRYNATYTFETFPFPEGLTPNVPAAEYAADPCAIRIAAAAKDLDAKRRAWLNPPGLVDIVPEIVPTAAPGEAPVKYPDRILPKSEEAAEILKTRTLTKLYNERPQWLADLHDTLDRAVAAAYGWPEDITTDDALARLLALNLARAAAGR